MNVNPQALSAIVGTGNVQTATIVPDLNSINNGKDVRISTDTGILNAHQSIEYDNTIYQRIQNEIRSTSTANNQIVIQPTLMGHADTSTMLLELEYTVSGSVVPTDSQQVAQDQFAYAQALAKLGAIYSNEAEDVTGNNVHFPEFGLLRGLSRTNVYLGTGSLLVQRTNMNLQTHYPVLINNRKYCESDLLNLAAIGMPCTLTSSKYKDTYSQYPLTPLDANYTLWQKRSFAEILYSYWALPSSSDYFSNNAINSAVRRTAVPMSYLNSFFAEKQFIPPSTKMRIELFTALTPQIMAVIEKAPYYTVGQKLTEDPKGVGIWTFKVAVSNARFNCNSYVLTQNAQLMDNNNWLTNPKTYNYNTFEYVPIRTDGATTVYTMNLNINQQRPTNIYFRVVSNLPDMTDLHPAGYKTFKDCTVPNVYYGNIKVNIAGRLSYELRRVQNVGQQGATFGLYTHQDFAMCLEDAMNIRTNRDTWRTPNENIKLIPDQWGGMANSVMPDMSINPGDMQSKDYYSADQGACTITMEIEVFINSARQPLPAGLQIIVYKKLQEQLLLSADGKATIIQWPAIKATNTNVKIPITFNQN